jgi:hypothetical protein
MYLYFTTPQLNATMTPEEVFAEYDTYKDEEDISGTYL